MRKLLSIFLCVIMLFSLSSCGRVRKVEPLTWGFSNYKIKNYEKNRTEIEYADKFMPSLDELDGYTNIGYSYQYTNQLMFEIYSMALYVEYPADIYEEKKIEVLSSYDFLEETRISKDGEYYQSPAARFEYGGYSFSTSVNTHVENYDNTYCKSFAFIGANDDKHRIAYCYTYDFDLDTFGPIDRFESEQEMTIKFISKFYDWNDLP